MKIEHVSVKAMSPADKAELLTAISSVLSVNKQIGTYSDLQDKCITKSILIIESIK